MRKKFNETLIGGVCNELLDYGKGFGGGFLYAAKAPYIIPTFVRSYKENKAIKEKLSKNGIEFEYADEESSFQMGLRKGVEIGTLFDFAQAIFYIGAAATDHWEYTVPMIASNVISGVYEMRREYKESSRNRVDRIVNSHVKNKS